MEYLWTVIQIPYGSAGNNFSLFRGHMSFQIFLLIGHLTNWTGHNLLTDNTFEEKPQDVLVTCSVIVSDHNVKLAGHFQNLVGQCPMTDCYFQHCYGLPKWSTLKILFRMSTVDQCVSSISNKAYLSLNTHFKQHCSTVFKSKHPF